MSVVFSRLLGSAVQALSRFEEGETLDNAVASSAFGDEIRPALQAVMYDLVRRYFLCDRLVDLLVTRPPSSLIRRVLMISLSEMITTPQKSYAIVNETIIFAKSYRSLLHATGFINACLRRYCREKVALTSAAMEDPRVRHNAPNWYYKKLVNDLGKTSADQLLDLAKIPPRLVLRVNRRQLSPEKWCEIAKEEGVVAMPLGKDGALVSVASTVDKIPGFREGLVSVQDAGAQLAAQFLSPKDGETILDACAAPGGKTGHLLEIADANVLALEVNPQRANLISDNLTRLNLQASVMKADATNPADWAGKRRFDAILLDAPCTASGILRRHPDIAFLRQPQDIDSLAKQQKKLLEALWPLLKFGGRLLYVVCSVFKEEGEKQLADFLKRHADAHGKSLGPGLPASITILPSDSEHGVSGEILRVSDGFFYALLTKG